MGRNIVGIALGNLGDFSRTANGGKREKRKGEKSCVLLLLQTGSGKKHPHACMPKKGEEKANKKKHSLDACEANVSVPVLDVYVRTC